MDLPTIDLATLPDLATALGQFGSLSAAGSAFTDDRIVVIMVYIYETIPPGGGL